MRLSPAEYVFVVAPIARPFDDYELGQLPKGMYDAGSTWFFVEAVTLTSGGGSYTDPYKSGVHNYGVGTTVQALWARAKADITAEERPFAPGDKVLRRNYSSGEYEGAERAVFRVDDTSRGQYVWLEPDEVNRQGEHCWHWGLQLCAEEAGK